MRSETKKWVYVKIQGEIVDRLRLQHIFYDNKEKTKAHLRDGREIVFEDGKWIYLPKRDYLPGFC